MKQYIDKAAVVAEINKFIDSLRKSCNPNPFGTMQECLADAEIEVLNLVLEYINTLEVKEVDLDTFGTLASHLIACDAHGISPKYSEKELDLLEKFRNDKTQKGE